MKKYLVTFLLFTLSIFGQSKTISVVYKAELFEEDKEFTSEFLEKMHKDAIKNSKFIRFNLLINGYATKFYDLPCLIISNENEKNLLKAFLGYTGILYTYKDTIFAESNFLGKRKLVEKSL